MTPPPGAPPARIPLAPVGLVWLVLVALLLIGALPDIAAPRFHDPDDILRLVQVRDLLAGQGWFDLRQYRIDPPQGTLMHWSRLVDAPLAAAIAVLTPALGARAAEQAALIAIPLLTLGAIVLVVGHLATRALHSVGAVMLATVCVGLSPLTMTQVSPFRIDHHGWQIFAVLLALVGLLPGRPVRGAVISGSALALGLSVSLEVLPMTVAVGAAFALRWLSDRQARAPLVAFLGSLAGGTTLLFLVTRGLADVAPHCDTVSPPYLGFFAVVAMGTGAVALVRPQSRGMIVALLALAAALAAGFFLWLAPACAAGPFGGLDPLVREFWYDQVREGRPVWEIQPDLWLPIVAQAALAIAVLVHLWRTSLGDMRRWWFEYLLVAAATFLTGMLVLRTMAFVGALSAVPLGWLALRMLEMVRERAGPIRKLGMVGAMALVLMPAFPVIAVKIAAASLGHPLDSPAKVAATSACRLSAAAPTLDRLEAATVFAPLDLGPTLLERTHHSVVATSHHRAEAAIRDVISAFLGTPDEARVIVLSHKATYVLACSDLSELATYRRNAPDGFAALLMEGRAPTWLEPVALAGPSELRLWRVKP